MGLVHLEEISVEDLQHALDNVEEKEVSKTALSRDCVLKYRHTGRICRVVRRRTANDRQLAHATRRRVDRTSRRKYLSIW